MVFNFGLDGAGRGVAHGDRLSHFLQHGGLIKGKKVEEGEPYNLVCGYLVNTK